MAKLQPMIAASQPDELMIITAVYDHDARKKSYSLLADAFGLGEEKRRRSQRLVVRLLFRRDDPRRPDQSCVSLNVARNGWPG